MGSILHSSSKRDGWVEGPQVEGGEITPYFIAYYRSERTDGNCDGRKRLRTGRRVSGKYMVPAA